MKIEQKEFGYDGHEISPREKKIIIDLVGEQYLTKLFNIKVEDHYYYIEYDLFFNRFDNFNELKDYILFLYFRHKGEKDRLLELLKTSKLDPSFDDNSLIWWAFMKSYNDIFRILLNDERVRSILSKVDSNIYTDAIS